MVGNNGRWAFPVLSASKHKMYDKKYISFTLQSIIHSVASGFGKSFVHQNVTSSTHNNYMRDLLQIYEVDYVNCTFKKYETYSNSSNLTIQT